MHLVLLLLFAVGCWSDVRVSVDEKGAYNISINDQVWLRSSHSAIYINDRWYSSDVGSLALANISFAEGSDPYLGDWNETQLNYGLVHNGIHTKILGSIRQWKSISAITFHLNTGNQSMMSTVPLDSNRVRTVFPGFNIEQIHVNDQRGYFAFEGIMTGEGVMHAGSWNSSSQIVRSAMESGPVVLFNLTQRGEEDVLILSPFYQFMATSFYQTHNFFEYGIIGSMSYVPANYQHSMIVFYSSRGINEGVREWGEIMQRAYNRTKKNRANDLTINYLGYYTDAGSYYYYHTEEGKNYEDTMVDVFDRTTLPFHYFQFDSWWYYQGIGGGVTNWTARPNVFPDGVQGVHHRMNNLSLAVHNRYWAYDTIYKENYSFVLDEANGKALPVGNDSFWIDLLSRARDWGVVLYEQDWLDLQTTGFLPTRTDIDLGHQWLMSMGEAADKLNLNIQYCMSLPRHILHALQIPRVTHTRVSFDYTYQLLGKEQTWAIGIPSMFADAIGLAPFKDVLWSTSLQPDSPYQPSPEEVLPERGILVATLSTGPVAPGDRINYTNVQRVMKCCRKDGLILKPDRPLTTINALVSDWALYNSISQGELYSTRTTINNQTFHIIFASAMKRDYLIYPSMIGSQSGIIWSYNSSNITSTFDSTTPLNISAHQCDNLTICLWYVSPLQSLNDSAETHYALLGEWNKWTAVSQQRFLSITTDTKNNRATIIVQGVPDETIPIVVYHSVLRSMMVNCSFSSDKDQAQIIVTPSNIICS